ncbi:VWA domain-containing protein [Algibacter pacificus]|uniref:VWA domain-containing protein n=1 Tax=Algibacter pacificus TaxID=2599389 RepID=UPI0011C7838C|nr:VWA domain-containing protein [Algibacter pacificus]
MQTETILYILLAGIIALGLSVFQYVNKTKSMSKLNMLFAFLRFITIFSVLILLINPKFTQTTFTTEKPNLVIAVDNSNSIKHLNQSEKVKTLVKTISENTELKNKFNLEFYTFGAKFQASDMLSFSEKQSNINEAFTQLSQIYKTSNAPTVLISDGNQTLGNDYEFASTTYKQPVYPIILGDTITYTDLKIQQLNVNKYAYLKNKFPVEAIVVYNGNQKVTSKFVVKQGNSVVFSKDVVFSKNNNSSLLNFSLPASRVGVSAYTATLIPIETEKNKVNNSKNFAVEVIDQKTNIAIVSSFYHPDLGSFKKSIESNERSTVSILKPNEIISKLNDFQLVILYQPNYDFKELFTLLNTENKNRFLVEGTKTDLDFLNENNKTFDHEITDQTEDYQAELNSNYTPFIIDDINYESFPPLKSNYGSVVFAVPFQTMLFKNVNGIATQEPLLATLETNGRREAVLFGENIWQWRAQSFLQTKSFQQFDDFIGKIVQYLASNKKRSRLNVDYESFYNGSGEIVIKAEFFDKNYVFDTRENLQIKITDKLSKEEKTLPLILKHNNYQVDLSRLAPSEYDFTVYSNNENLSKSGSFQILQYNVEEQFLNANVSKLQQLAKSSEGTSYFIDHTDTFINDLIKDNRYQTVQKKHNTSLPLIDWKYLLGIIAISLAAEWFLRKYNGLI